MNLQAKTERIIQIMQAKGINLDTAAGIQTFALTLLNSVADQTGVYYCPDVSFGYIHRRTEHPRDCQTCRDDRRAQLNAARV
jgi:hypothetical protein